MSLEEGTTAPGGRGGARGGSAGKQSCRSTAQRSVRHHSIGACGGCDLCDLRSGVGSGRIRCGTVAAGSPCVYDSGGGCRLDTRPRKSRRQTS